MGILDNLGSNIIDIETEGREEDNGYHCTFKYHVNFGDGQAHYGLEALQESGIPRKGSPFPDATYPIYANSVKVRHFEGMRDYFIVTVEFGPRSFENISASRQSPLTKKPEVTWQSTLVDEFITEDRDDVRIAAPNGQIIGTTVQKPIFEGQAVWNQKNFNTNQFDGKIGKINSNGLRLGNYYFAPETFMPLGVSDSIQQFVDGAGRNISYYQVTMPFSYKPGGYAVRKRMQGNYFLSPSGEPYYPRIGNTVIRDVTWDLKANGRPFVDGNGVPSPTAEAVGEEPVYKTFNPIPKVDMRFNGAS